MSDIDINVLLGMVYLLMILINLDSLIILVIVGYNVGLGCLKCWCLMFVWLVEGVIFVEMILFNEICMYVKNVLLNVMYYSVLLIGCL